MKTSFSILSLLGIVSIAALAVALGLSKAKISETEFRVTELETQSLTLRSRLGEQANDSESEFSICFFADPYAGGNVLRWRIKSPADSRYRLMYSKRDTPEADAPQGGRELNVDNAKEFVLSVEFTEEQLHIRTFPETPDGSPNGPNRATSIRGDSWIDLLASPKNEVLTWNYKPNYFKLDVPLEILTLEGESEVRLSIWLESID